MSNSTPAADNKTLTDNHPVNILLVDDRPERLLSYEVILEPLGYNLICAESGEEALGKLMQTSFATILLDVSMPGMDGFETATLIRQHPRFEEMPIIFVTGVQITDFDRRKGYEIGAVDYVQIPVVPSILRAKIYALVQLYLQRAELARVNKQLAHSNQQLELAHEELKAENLRELQQLNQTLEAANNELQQTNGKLTQEIHERKKAEQALFEASKRKDHYIAILGHELRNPLSAIHNAVQVMQLSESSPAQQTWAQDLLQRQVQHLTCLMDDLLDVSRITSGRIQLRLEPLDLKTVAKQAAETLMPLLNQHQQTLQLSLPDKPLFVKGDMVRLTQVLDNLLTNAAKYMNDGGTVHLSVTEEEPEWVAIRVRDQGVGIDKAMLEEVFELFVQAPTAINRAQGGLGIGLALVRALVDLHGGNTLVKSEGQGKGAEFIVRLPTHQAVSVSKESPSPPVTENEASTFKILIVDDNRDSAAALAICLQTIGYDIRVSHSGYEGLTQADRFLPDIVLLDIGLPDINGYEVVRRLRARNIDNPEVVIAMTGYSGEKERNQAKEAGFDHYLVKPLDFPALLTILNNQTVQNID